MVFKTLTTELNEIGLIRFADKYVGLGILALRSFSKWWLEVVRNLVDVAVLQYFATKSGNIYLHILAVVSFYLLVFYVYSFILGIAVPLTSHPIIAGLIGLFAGILTIYLGARLLSLATQLVDEVAKLQTQ